ncbi:TPA: antitermination protein [Yersinia enterocolitica]|uniref:antitermination protein Q n=1 Tax=Yersinia enterocolitica TaxID=630 RepID=UPI000327E5E9|nr:antitermination protein [Yersinia enterocolitica]CCV60928.1 phage antitermination protein [Yersinia enterocolitica (type O:2) str. YE3094/96]CFV19573.1 antitermination protein [Yersinia enterocolitica]CNE04984.1 antitermination protein [Yersinia enterocolitica]HDL6966406.1 antitermination protein [Yersinia enterocolitica]HDL6974614.1 antitermination protein [Yersinia enterocolitica]
MKLESAMKQFSAKSQMITDSPRATSSDSLKGPDLAAAMGMVEARAGFGMAAYLGKVGISKEDRIRTVEQLTQFAMKNAPKHVGKASGRRMAQCMVILAKFAYEEYSSSAAATTPCKHCKGKGLIYSIQKVVKHPGCGEKTDAWIEDELVGELCIPCNGKGKISHRCRCNGTGKVRDLDKSKRLGVPVEKECERCSGIGYKRTPSTTAYRAITALLPELNERTWRRNWKPFYESLVAKCDIEESYAEDEFQRITR